MRIEPLGKRDKECRIPIGQKIDVYIPEGDFQGIYSSYLYDMDDEALYILTPTHENGLKAILHKNQEFYISFVDDKNRRIGFLSALIDIVERDSTTLYKVKKPTDELYIVEFRENFRVDVISEATIVYRKKGRLIKTKGTIIDISASGAKISLSMSIKDELDIGDIVFISFEVEDIKVENVEAKVVRKAISKTDDVNHYGIKFLGLDKRTEDKIIKFCIHKQFELARKKRGL